MDSHTSDNIVRLSDVRETTTKEEEMQDILNQRSGEIPADLSDEARATRFKRMRVADCNGVEAPEAWTHPSLATLEEQVARIATIEGKDAEFAKSLAEQYKKKGELSPKQAGWVARLYRKYADKNYWRRFGALNHDWQLVGSVTHHANFTLNTHLVSKYYKCAKCGEMGEKRDEKNYSGD